MNIADIDEVFHCKLKTLDLDTTLDKQQYIFKEHPLEKYYSFNQAISSIIYTIYLTKAFNSWDKSHNKYINEQTIGMTEIFLSYNNTWGSQRVEQYRLMRSLWLGCYGCTFKKAEGMYSISTAHTIELDRNIVCAKMIKKTEFDKIIVDLIKIAKSNMKSENFNIAQYKTELWLDENYKKSWSIPLKKLCDSPDLNMDLYYVSKSEFPFQLINVGNNQELMIKSLNDALQDEKKYCQEKLAMQDVFAPF